MPTEAEIIDGIYNRFDDHVRRLDGHDRHIADLSTVVFGNDVMKVPGLSERTRDNEKQIDEIQDYIREQKLLMRVATGLLTAITAGGGIIAIPQILQVLSSLGGGGP